MVFHLYRNSGYNIIAPSRRRSESGSRAASEESLKNSLYVWAGPNTEWLKECDIKLELSRINPTFSHKGPVLPAE